MNFLRLIAPGIRKRKWTVYWLVLAFLRFFFQIKSSKEMCHYKHQTTIACYFLLSFLCLKYDTNKNRSIAQYQTITTAVRLMDLIFSRSVLKNNIGMLLSVVTINFLENNCKMNINDYANGINMHNMIYC